jgi:hypothetical protein
MSILALSIPVPAGWKDSSGDSMGDWMPSIISLDGRFQIFVDDESCSYQTREVGVGAHHRFTLWDTAGYEPILASSDLSIVLGAAV